jgi:hypothetical protein
VLVHIALAVAAQDLEKRGASAIQSDLDGADGERQTAGDLVVRMA